MARREAGNDAARRVTATDRPRGEATWGCQRLFRRSGRVCLSAQAITPANTMNMTSTTALISTASNGIQKIPFRPKAIVVRSESIVIDADQIKRTASCRGERFRARRIEDRDAAVDDFDDAGALAPREGPADRFAWQPALI